jgi:hypothetical protein
MALPGYLPGAECICEGVYVMEGYAQHLGIDPTKLFQETACRFAGFVSEMGAWGLAGGHVRHTVFPPPRGALCRAGA